MILSSDNSIYNTGSRKSKDVFWYTKLMKMEAKLDAACQTIDELKKENKSLKDENRKLRDENARLQSIIDNNSKNSSLPPSTDQKPSKAPNEYNGRKKTNKRPGSQPGRLGTTLTAKQVKAKIAEGAYLHRTIADENVYSKYVVDLEINVVAYENMYSKRNFVSFGPLIRSLAVDLYAEGAVSFNRITSLLNNLTSGTLDISIGAVYGFVSDFARLCRSSLAHIEQDLLKSPAIYTDSTNVNMNGLQQYIRNYSTEHSVLYRSLAKKSLSTMRQENVLKNFGGTLIHDHETAMYHFGTSHSECNAHLLRYLRKSSEEAKNSWSDNMQSFLIGINKHRQDLLANHVNTFTAEELARYSKRYDEIISLGLEQNKHTKPRYAWREERKLLTRLQKYKTAQLRFMYDFNIDLSLIHISEPTRPY